MRVVGSAKRIPQNYGTLDSDPNLYPPSVLPLHLRKRPSIFRPGFLYVVQRSYDGAVKIGISVHPKKRLTQLRCDYIHGRLGELRMLAVMRVESMRQSELVLHSKYRRFKLNGYREWFLLPSAALSDLVSGMEHADA